MATNSLMILRIILFALLSLAVPDASSVSFNFNFSDSKTVLNNITREAASLYVINRGSISLTGGANNKRSFGRATYNQPVLLWDDEEVTNFTTQFSFLIENTSNLFGDGFAFFLTEYPSSIPSGFNGWGGLLGLFNDSTALDAYMNHIVAIEFDSFWNRDIDPNKTDSNPCHVGIDVNTIISTNYTFIPNCGFVNSTMNAKIEYDSGCKLLSLLLWSDTDLETNFSLIATVDLRKELPTKCAVGFSAGTGDFTEVHHIFSWSFNSTLEPKQNPPDSPVSNQTLPDLPPSKDKGMKSTPLIVGIVAGTFVMFSLVVILIYYLRKRKSLTNNTPTELELIDSEFEKRRGPKKFSYSELADATDGFSENEKLGEGGFGSVYKGILKDTNINVAIKRVSKESQQGKKEYIAEVKIISQLRHRNLVQLIGWCHDYGEFLLVYELMQNGSLDRHLYTNENLLTWPIRHDIGLGLGSALLYLHEECEQCVVHRDVKPSNLMLDSSFNAKLGDFGLARLTNHYQDIETTMVAGTRGYLAPECVLGTEKASTQSDVFSFGVVLLEIVCGRMPIVHQEDQTKVSLVKWVWDLYGQNSLLEAVDGRLNGDFEREEVECFMVVGLWCTHPDKSSRPSMRQVMAVLQYQARLPVLPPKMPLPVYAAPVDLDMQLNTTSSEATSGGIASTSTST